jgi:hypothetical protein
MVPHFGVSIMPALNTTTRRRHGRVRAHDVHCTFGRVLDISASGLRVLTRRALRAGQERILEVLTHDGKFAARVRVAWSRRAGVMSRQVGLQFLDLPPQARGILNACARVAGTGSE